MTKYSSQSQKQQTTQDHSIKERIDNVLDFKPKIKIRKLQQGTVAVNHHVIENRSAGWACDGVYFYRRKSAVGYALCLINDDRNTALQIRDLDQKLKKIKIDLDVYYASIRGTNNKTRKEILSHRISCDMPLLKHTDTQLTRLLKTINI